jgi:hypothetical protein
LSPVAKGRHESRAANRFGSVIGVEGGHWVGIRRSARARWVWTSPPPASSGHPLLSLRKSALFEPSVPLWRMAPRAASAELWEVPWRAIAVRT